jgi:hypothetical protein
MVANSLAMAGVPGVDYLLVSGNVKLGKDKGQGQLLLTRSTLFAFRVKQSAVTMTAVHFGLLGGLIAHFIEKQRAKKRTPPEHLRDPEIEGLGPELANKINRGSLLAKLPLNKSLKIERTKMGFQFSSAGELVVYQGFMSKGKITDFLALQGIDVR